MFAGTYLAMSFIRSMASLFLATNMKNTTNNPTGTTSVTANAIHRTVLPGHDRVMTRPMAGHVANAVHHSPSCVVSYALRPTLSVPPLQNIAHDMNTMV